LTYLYEGSLDICLELKFNDGSERKLAPLKQKKTGLWKTEEFYPIKEDENLIIEQIGFRVQGNPLKRSETLTIGEIKVTFFFFISSFLCLLHVYKSLLYNLDF